MESPPHYFPSVVFTIYVFIYIFGGVADVDNCIPLKITRGVAQDQCVLCYTANHLDGF